MKNSAIFKFFAQLSAIHSPSPKEPKLWIADSCSEYENNRAPFPTTLHFLVEVVEENYSCRGAALVSGKILKHLERKGAGR